jgi:succinate-acetate transporter protein
MGGADVEGGEVSDIDSSAPPQPAAFAPQAGVGLPLAIACFGFSVIVLGLADARVFTPNAIGLFAPVAMATGALGLFVGGVIELRANNTFGGTFAVLYAAFLLTTGLIVRWFSPWIIDTAGAGGFGDAFGAWLLLWGVFTVLLSAGAYFINLPAFLAFTLLEIPYFLLGIASIVGPADPADALTRIAGWILIADGIAAWYLAWASAMNALIGERLPLWPYPYAHKEAVAPPTSAVPAH